MKGIILAAGTGSRLRPITLHKPKCAVTVGGQSILEHQLQAYESSPVEECIIATGYKHEYVSELCSELASSYDLTISTARNEVYANTDNLYSLYRVFEEHEVNEFVLSNGDVVFPTDSIELLFEADVTNGILCDPQTYSEEGMKIKTEKNYKITGISKEISKSAAFATSTDVYLFRNDAASKFIENVRARIQKGPTYDLWVEEEMNQLLENSSNQFNPVSLDTRPWTEIDDHDDLAVADRQFADLGDLREKQAAFFDLDGTIYVDEDLSPGADHLVRTLRDNDVSVFFLSNNSSADKQTYAEKLGRMGIEVDEEQIILSTDGVVRHLTQSDVDSTYVVGTKQLRSVFRRHDIDPVAEEPSHVIVGFDRELTYEKLRRASQEIQRGARFFLTHPDFGCPSEGGMIPDAGAISAAIERTVDSEPDRVFGKPKREMIEHVLDDDDLAPEDIVIVGDRLRTEMELADRLGADSVCVLTGDADRVDVEQSSVTPNAVLPDVGSLQRFVE